jgi:hypothetical protein
MKSLLKGMPPGIVGKPIFENGQTRYRTAGPEGPGYWTRTEQGYMIWEGDPAKPQGELNRASLEDAHQELIRMKQLLDENSPLPPLPPIPPLPVLDMDPIRPTPYFAEVLQANQNRLKEDQTNMERLARSYENSRPEMKLEENPKRFCETCSQELPVLFTGSYRDNANLNANLNIRAVKELKSMYLKSLARTIGLTFQKRIMILGPNVWYFLIGLWLLLRWVFVLTVGIWCAGDLANQFYFHWNVSVWHEGNLSMPYLAWFRTWLLGLPVVVLFFAGWGIFGAIHHFGMMHVKYRHIQLPPGPPPG